VHSEMAGGFNETTCATRSSESVASCAAQGFGARLNALRSAPGKVSNCGTCGRALYASEQERGGGGLRINQRRMYIV